MVTKAIASAKNTPAETLKMKTRRGAILLYNNDFCFSIDIFKVFALSLNKVNLHVKKKKYFLCKLYNEYYKKRKASVLTEALQKAYRLVFLREIAVSKRKAPPSYQDRGSQVPYRTPHRSR